MGIGKMRATWIALGCFIAIGIATSGTVDAERLADADQGGRSIFVLMTGAEEAPGPGDPDGSGTAHFTFNVGQSEVCYELTVEDIAPATAAHIHRAPVGEPGDIVIPLDAPTDGSSSGCATADRALIKEIVKNPAAFYVNVHNADFRPGAVRGQLG